MHLSSVSIDNKGFEHSLDLTGASATLSVTTNGNYLLRFSEAGSSLVLSLERDQIDALAAICAAPPDRPSANPADIPPTSPTQVGLALLRLDNLGMQMWLREISAETLINGLWYLKNADLIRFVTRNMALRAAQGLVEDLETRWHGVNPVTASDTNRDIGEAAIQIFIVVLDKLIQQGRCANLSGDLHG